MDTSDQSFTDAMMQETSLLPGSFPSSHPVLQPQQENPPLILEDADLSFLPISQDQQRTPRRVNNRDGTLMRSPVFSFKSHKPVYPNIFDDADRGKENGSDQFGFHFENDVLNKKFSKKLSNKVLQELDSRMNEYGPDDIKRNLFSPRSQIRSQVRQKITSPRSQVQRGFNTVHRKNFNKMESINNHYSIHQQAEVKPVNEPIVMKKRKTVTGTRNILAREDTTHEERPHKPTLDPRLNDSKRFMRPTTAATIRTPTEPRRTLDPRKNNTRTQSTTTTIPRSSTTTTIPRSTTDRTLHRKSSFLQPTAASLSKLASVHDPEPIRKSSTTFFRTQNITRSTTMADLKDRYDSDQLLQHSSIDSRLKHSHSQHHSINRPVWR